MYAYLIDMQSSYNVMPVSQSAGMSQGTAEMSQGNPVFTLQWLTGKIRKCYRCASNIHADTSAVPKSPYVTGFKKTICIGTFIVLKNVN